VAKRKRPAEKWYDIELKSPKVETAHSKKLRGWSLTDAELAQLTAAVNKLK